MAGKNDNYDIADIFDEFEKEKALEETRPGFAVSKCCGNCKYFKYHMGNQRRGMCFIEVQRAGRSLQAEIPNTREAFIDARDSNKYPKTHITCVCDSHLLKGEGSINSVNDYCGENLRLKDDD